MPGTAVATPGEHPWVILLVDDEPDILDSIQRLVESSLPHVKVVTAQSGRLGLEVLDRERIDLIISDFRMPGMDGIEFLYQCRRQHPTVPRVMMTAYASDELARRAIVDTFVSTFLSKAVQPPELLLSISRLLTYSPPPSAEPAELPVA